MKSTPTWVLPLIVLLSFACISTVIFWITDLDIRCTAIFYTPPPASESWSQEFNPLWQLFFYGAPLLVAFIAIGSAITLIMHYQHPYLGRYAAYIILTLALGPGLLINLVLKDHWGRPRPYQIQAFGGNMSYLPPLMLGASSAHKSFPAGHASVGFSLCAFWFLWRKRKPRLSKLALILSLALGFIMGLGRIATGAHFLSDVLWSGFITFFIAWALYYFGLRIPDYEATMASNIVSVNSQYHWKKIGFIGVGLTVLIGALLGFPIHETIDFSVPAKHLPLPPNLNLHLRYADVTIYLDNSQTPPLRVMGKMNGFGFPTYKIDSHSKINLQRNKLEYIFKQRGFFTELDTSLVIKINVSNLKHLTVRVRKGDIRVFVAKGIVVPKLDLNTVQGQLFFPPFFQQF